MREFFLGAPRQIIIFIPHYLGYALTSAKGTRLVFLPGDRHGKSAPAGLPVFFRVYR
jgi:hypothetical protein